jgi:hypothetical protein
MLACITTEIDRSRQRLRLLDTLDARAEPALAPRSA